MLLFNVPVYVPFKVPVELLVAVPLKSLFNVPVYVPFKVPTVLEVLLGDELPLSVPVTSFS